MKHITIFTAAMAIGLCASATDTYTNPVIPKSLPDPTVTRAADGTFYLFATENTRNVPIYRSANLVDWTFAGTAFTDATRPQWNPKGAIWAPDINETGGKYLLYYSKSEWGGEWTESYDAIDRLFPMFPLTVEGIEGGMKKLLAR